MVESVSEVILREFASYITRLVQWDKPHNLVYRMTDAGEQYVGGYALEPQSNHAYPPIWYWSTFQFQTDIPYSGNFVVVKENGADYSQPGLMPHFPTPDPLKWIIDRSERQLLEHWQSLQAK